MNSGLCPMCIRLTKRRRGKLKTAMSEVFLLAVMRYFPSNVTARFLAAARRLAEFFSRLSV
jgi:hypothetical protein